MTTCLEMQPYEKLANYDQEVAMSLRWAVAVLQPKLLVQLNF